MFDTAFSYERALIVCSFVQDFYKGKGNNLQFIYDAHIAFLFWWADIMAIMQHFRKSWIEMVLLQSDLLNPNVTNMKPPRIDFSQVLERSHILCMTMLPVNT